MNEINTLLAAKLIKHIKDNSFSNTSDVEELIAELSADKNGLHLCYNKAYLDEDKTVEEMTIEEYRSYTENKINLFPMHFHQKKVNYTIHITEIGLLAMKSDKGYEKQVHNTIQTAFNQSHYSPFSENCLLYFDDKENSCSLSWSSMKNIQAGSQVEDAGTTESPAVSSKMHKDLDRKTKSEYIFKRVSPGYVLIPPSSRYAKALYAYNIAPDDWLQNKKTYNNN